MATGGPHRIRAASRTTQHEATFHRRDDRGGQLDGVLLGQPEDGEARTERLDPTGEHPVGRGAEPIVRAGDLEGDGADRAGVEVAGLLEHGAAPSKKSVMARRRHPAAAS